MRLRLGTVLATAITMVAGLITLFGLLIGDNVGLLSLLARGTFLREISSIFLQLVRITIAIAVLIGVLNLLLVHLGRVFRRRDATVRVEVGSRLYSLVMLLSFVLVIGTYLFARPTSLILLNTVQVSIESALAGLLLFALVYGAATATRRRTTWAGLLFVVTIVIILVGALPLNGTTPLAARGLDLIGDIRDWIMAIPVNAGARGILLGIALATIVTGVRVLIGQERSYRE